jgi:hypothetical protein
LHENARYPSFSQPSAGFSPARKVPIDRRGSNHDELGFDHGVGHPLLLLYDAKAFSGRKNKAFKGLGHHAEWPKVADVVIKAEI